MGAVWCKADKGQTRSFDSKRPFNSVLSRWTDHMRQHVSKHRKPKTMHRPPRPPKKPLRANERLTISHPQLVVDQSSDGWRTATLLVPEAPVPPPRKKRRRHQELTRTAYSMDDLDRVGALGTTTTSLQEMYHSETGLDGKGSSTTTLVVNPVLESRLEIVKKHEEDKEKMSVNVSKTIKEEDEDDIEEVDLIIPIEKETLYSSRTILQSNLGYIDKLSAISEVSAESGFDDRIDVCKGSERSESAASTDSDMMTHLNNLHNSTQCAVVHVRKGSERSDTEASTGSDMMTHLNNLHNSTQCAVVHVRKGSERSETEASTGSDMMTHLNNLHNSTQCAVVDVRKVSERSETEASTGSDMMTHLNNLHNSTQCAVVDVRKVSERSESASSTDSDMMTHLNNLHNSTQCAVVDVRKVSERSESASSTYSDMMTHLNNLQNSTQCAVVDVRKVSERPESEVSTGSDMMTHLNNLHKSTQCAVVDVGKGSERPESEASKGSDMMTHLNNLHNSQDVRKGGERSESAASTDSDMMTHLNNLHNSTQITAVDVREKTALSKKEWLQNILREEAEPYFLPRELFKGSESPTDDRAVDTARPDPSAGGHLHLMNKEAAEADNNESKTSAAPSPLHGHSVLLGLLQDDPQAQAQQEIFLTNTKTNIIYKSLSSDRLTDDYEKTTGSERGGVQDCTNLVSDPSHLSDYLVQAAKLAETDPGPLQDKTSKLVSSFEFKQITPSHKFGTPLTDWQLPADKVHEDKSNVVVNGALTPITVTEQLKTNCNECDLKHVVKCSQNKDSAPSSRRSSLTDSLHEFEMSIYDMLKESKLSRDSSDEEDSFKTVIKKEKKQDVAS